MREDAKQEAKLKALLKEPPNKRCINCDSLVRGGQQPYPTLGPAQGRAPDARSSLLPPPRCCRAPSTWSPTITCSSALYAAASSECRRLHLPLPLLPAAATVTPPVNLPMLLQKHANFV